MDILVTDTNEVAARADAINRAPQGWLVGDSIYPGDLTLVAGVTIPAGLADKRLSYVGGVFVELPPIVDPEVEEARRKAIMAEVVERTQQRLDAFAQTRFYDGILSACTYATSPTPRFQADGQYCVEARDATWAKLYEMLAEVEAGTRPMPTGYADIEGELPVLVWPE